MEEGRKEHIIQCCLTLQGIIKNHIEYQKINFDEFIENLTTELIKLAVLLRVKDNSDS